MFNDFDNDCRKDIADRYTDLRNSDCGDSCGIEEEQFDETTLQNGLMELMSYGYDSSEICWENLRVRTYEEAGVMTYDKGLVITTPDGQEFQLTIVRSM